MMFNNSHSVKSHELLSMRLSNFIKQGAEVASHENFVRKRSNRREKVLESEKKTEKLVIQLQCQADNKCCRQ
jgi:ribosomal protein S8